MMNVTFEGLAYQNTGFFSKLVSDYLQQSPLLQPFYEHTPDIEGIQRSIEARKRFNTPRTALVEALKEQYGALASDAKVIANINALSDSNTFTVVTAHQPNIFTGPLYFIYKILHAIKLAEELKAQLPEYTFVPVYYMGSEDADLDELGYINIGAQKLVWETKQTGAVGRMKVDKAFGNLIHAIEGQIGVLPYGKELVTLFRICYTEGKTIQQAALELVNGLFGRYGLVVLIPDSAKLKTAFNGVVEKELLEGFSHKAVAATIAALGENYKVQAGGREINLFYLIDNKRERIELQEGRYIVNGLNLQFSRDEILQELKFHPERFSANVILRGAFQETILPNIAFIGGGGELAYWLELKQVFAAVAIPYPVLLLRNSFLLANKEQEAKWKQLNLSATDLFEPAQSLLNKVVKQGSALQLDLQKELQEAGAYYEKLKQLTGAIDTTLTQHVAALEAKAIKRLQQLEKKMLRAERNKFDIQQRQITRLKDALFANNSLQERTDNFSLWYAQYGEDWLDMLYAVSEGFGKTFKVVVV